jgi:18S rRNA (guanine1575-N7)-methyltransferase
MSRPELQLPPDLFYNNEESRKYTSSSRIIQVRCLVFWR